MEYQTYGIYYDEEGDFLEVTFGESPELEYTDEAEQGVFVTRNEQTGDVYSIGILSFKKRVQILGRILSKFGKKLPGEIDISKWDFLMSALRGRDSHLEIMTLYINAY